MSKQYNERFTDADLKKMAELLAALQNQPVQRERELGIDFLELAQTLWKKAWAILLAAVIIVGSFLAYTVFFFRPKYTAETLLYVICMSIAVIYPLWYMQNSRRWWHFCWF